MSERLRSRLSSRSALVIPGCYDALSAMLLERAEFEAVFLSGYGVAASLLGNPDIGLTGLSETSMMARHVAAAVQLPVLVDADNGYGDEHHVRRTVSELEHAGAAGMVLEDQVLPKRCGHWGRKDVIPLPAYLRKLEQALAARRTPLVVVARTDASDLDDAIARAKASHAAGADVTMIEGLTSLEAIRRVGGEVAGAKQVNLILGGRTPLLSVKDLEAMGFQIVVYSTPALYVAASAVTRAMKRLREADDLRAVEADSLSLEEFQRFMEARYESRSAAVPGISR
jgi:2-methylisocitrate lyase-like PEP mutase family enzyme